MAEVQTKNVFDLLAGDDEPEVEQEPAKPAAAPKKEGVRGGAASRGAARGGRSDGVTRGGRPPKHEHERKSATGRSHETTKKGGAGKYSWGKEDETAAEPAAAATDAAAPAASGDAPAEAAAEEDNTVGLDDYLKSLESKRPVDDRKIAPRAPVVDEKAFKGKVLEKAEEETLFADMARAKKEKAAKEAKKKNVVSLDEWNAKIPQPAREAREDSEPRTFERRDDGERRGRGGFRGGRGRGGDAPAGAGSEERGRGRGGFRGGRGRGGRGGERGGDRGSFGGRGRGGAPRGATPNVNLNDDAAFPSLGK